MGLRWNFFVTADLQNASEDLTLNCFSNGQAMPVTVDESTGFDVTTSYPDDFTTVLDFTFTGGIVTFLGYDSTSPTVEFCVKITLGDAQYRKIAVRYTIDLNGLLQLISAAKVDAAGAVLHEHALLSYNVYA